MTAKPALCSVRSARLKEPRMGDFEMAFTYVASASSSGNANVRRVCNNPKCKGVMYVTQNASNYRCPHCDWKQ